MALASILAAGREYESHGITLAEQAEHLKQTYGADVHLLHNEEIAAASADIRRRVREGKSISGIVPKAVAEYIRDRRLYVAGGDGKEL